MNNNFAFSFLFSYVFYLPVYKILLATIFKTMLNNNGDSVPVTCYYTTNHCKL